MLTGQQIGELCNAEWSEIDFKTEIWTIPNAKNGKENCLPLHYESLLCFSELSVFARESRFVCQSPKITDKEKPILNTSINRAVKQHQDYFGIEKWVPHDLRRTVSTHLNKIGIEPLIVEKILNHSMQDVMGVYKKTECWGKKVKALEMWEQKIKKEGGKGGQIFN